VTGWWFSPGTPVSSTNKTDRHDIAEILLKVALITSKPANKQTNSSLMEKIGIPFIDSELLYIVIY
jgi:hypothetical protein